MDKNEYFGNIAEKVHAKRIKGEYSKNEMEIYEEGKKSALLSLLIYLNNANTDMFQRHTYENYELQNFIELEIESLRSRLRKAREIYLVNQRIIKQMSQLSID